MKKSKRQLNSERVLNMLEANGYEFEILNKNKKGVVNHVRVNGWGDIWPTTFTFLKDGKWTRGDAQALFDALLSQDRAGDDVLDYSYAKTLAELNSLIPMLGFSDDLEKFCIAQLKKAGYSVEKVKIKKKSRVVMTPEGHESARVKRNKKRLAQGLPEIPSQLIKPIKPITHKG